MGKTGTGNGLVTGEKQRVLFRTCYIKVATIKHSVEIGDHRRDKEWRYKVGGYQQIAFKAKRLV